MRTYGEFCPIAKAAEIVAERWTPLVIRELIAGSHRFSDLEHGLPGISRSLLVQRLRMLERAGVIERRMDTGGKKPEYHLTPAGQELSSLIMELGRWGQRWVNRDVGAEDADPRLLMWDMRRRLHLDKLPDRRVVLQFDFTGVKPQTIWLVVELPEPSVCLHDPGFGTDMFVTADTMALHRIWMGQLSFRDALRRELVLLEGPPELVRSFPSWLALSMFAGVPPAVQSSSH